MQHYVLVHSASRFSAPLRIIMAGLLVLALGVVATWSALGGGVLEHVVPSEYQGDATIPATSEGRALEVTPAASIAELAQIAGFALLVPQDVPARCGNVRSTHYVAETNAASIDFGCLSIEQSPANGMYRPLAPEGSLEQVLVQQQPAIYFVTPLPGGPPPSRGPHTAPDGWQFRDLIFEANGRIVRFRTHPSVLPITEQTAPLTKDELIRVAESMTLRPGRE